MESSLVSSSKPSSLAKGEKGHSHPFPSMGMQKNEWEWMRMDVE